jgi:hypothetical protein
MVDDPVYAFFDEYGEEGFTDKASEWFVLSAALQYAVEHHTDRLCYAQFLDTWECNDNWHFHFVKCDHRKRLAFIEEMRFAGYTFMSVVVHKRSLSRTANFKRPYYLYFFAAKLLLERISWHCRATGRELSGAFFSNRRGLKADDVEVYINHLRRNDWGLSNSIYWPALECTEYFVEHPKKRIGLQLADLKASSVGHAIDPHHGITEPRYVLELKNHVYNRKGSRLSYGLKFFPRLTDEMRAEPRFAWLEEFER